MNDTISKQALSEYVQKRLEQAPTMEANKEIVNLNRLINSGHFDSPSTQPTSQWMALREQVKTWITQQPDGSDQSWSTDELKGHERAWRYVLNAMDDLEALSFQTEDTRHTGGGPCCDLSTLRPFVK